MSWCGWCDMSKCPNWEWNREVVDSIIEKYVKQMPSENMSDKMAITIKVKEELKERDLWIKWCMLCLQVNEYVDRVKSDVITIT